MGSSLNEHLVATKVLVKFEDGPVSFRIPRGATLANLSEKFSQIRRWHKGPARSSMCALALHPTARASRRKS